MLKQKIIYQLDAGAYKPVKAHEADAGFDLFAREDVALSPDKTFKVDTGVHVLIPEGYVGLVLPRSSYNCAGVATPTGVIDSGYTGEIAVVLNAVDVFTRIKKGDRIAQLVVAKLADIDDAVAVDDLEATERGTDGFGSTGA